MSRAARLSAVLVGLAGAAALIAYYVVGYLMITPPVVAATGNSSQASVTMQTVATLGFGPHPDWVSYLIKNPQGKWVHSTVLQVPANALIHVTIYQYDTSTGLRNPFWGQPQGTVGDPTLNGKAFNELNPDLASHTFAIPELGVSVPLDGVSTTAKNPCSVAPCTLKETHNTVVFTFRTGKKGLYRWQCMVPCAAAFILGFGGPMQSLGYMDGLLHVV
jgi:hypothetical protein